VNTDHLRDMSPVIPMLSYEDVARAADRITDAFGFRETGRWTDADGRVTHVNMEHRGGVIMLGFPSPDNQGPRHHAENCEHARSWSTTQYIIDGALVCVSDIDTHFERAQASGATVLSSPEDDREAGQRQYRAEDLEGHRWMFAQPI
jgi:PhnB protein